MKKYYGCWMHLSDKDNKKLSPIIAKLSKKYANGDIFPPHISANSAALLGLEEAKKAAIDCIKGVRKFEVEMVSIQYSEKWSKTLFIKVKDDPNLTKISKCLSKTFRKDLTPYLLSPHISLLYKEGMSSKEKRSLANKLKVPKKFLVSSIAVVTTGNVNDWRDYGNWKIVFEKELK